MLVALVTAVECRDADGVETESECVTKLYQVTVVERDSYRKHDDVHVGVREVELDADLPYSEVLEACRTLRDAIVEDVQDVKSVLTKLNSEINDAR